MYGENVDKGKVHLIQRRRYEENFVCVFGGLPKIGEVFRERVKSGYEIKGRIA